MIMGRFTVVRVYKFLLSALGDRLYFKSRLSFSALGKFIGLLPFPSSRNSGKRGLTSGLAWGPGMPKQWHGKRAVNVLRAIETYKKTKKLQPSMLAFGKQQC